jgi:hypothetical protein
MALAEITAVMAHQFQMVAMVVRAVVVHRMLVTQLQVAEVRQHQQPVLGLHMETSARAEVVEPVVLAAAREVQPQEVLEVPVAQFLVQLLQLVDQIAEAQTLLLKGQEMVEASRQPVEKEVREL